ncbi:MAG: tRNA lysidine(34) synthetase TilS [Vampirovibrio sp.]|nr:tRNA lysidine(34) synthetase TilS [Vampirovibrio sp.]
MPMMQETVLQNLKAQGLLVEGRPAHVVLGYSGGVDSAVLLHVLAQLRQHHPLTVTAAYYNHGWRDNPPEELAILHKTCLELKIQLVLIPTVLSAPKTEHGARQVRYRLLTELAHEIGAHALLTAHHADDQVETILFRMFRGTGTDGLVGIKRKLVLNESEGKPVSILRPMLDISRSDIATYAKHHNLLVFKDPANRDARFLRNVIREEILPQIDRRFPNARTSMLKLSELVSSDLDLLNDRLENIWQRLFDTDGGLDVLGFGQLPRSYQRRVMKHWLQSLQLDPSFQTVEDTVDFLTGGNRKHPDTALLSLPQNPKQTDKNRFISLYKNRAKVIEVKPDVLAGKTEPPAPMLMDWEGTTVLPDLNVKIKCVKLTPEQLKKIKMTKPDSHEVYVDLSMFNGLPLHLRTRQSGDRMIPLGMNTPVRLKNVLMNKGVSRFERDQLPLLANGQNVLWVPGLGLSEDVRILDKPTHRLVLKAADDDSDTIADTEDAPKVVVPALVGTDELETDLENTDDKNGDEDGVDISASYDEPDSDDVEGSESHEDSTELF